MVESPVREVEAPGAIPPNVIRMGNFSSSGISLCFGPHRGNGTSFAPRSTYAYVIRVSLRLFCYEVDPGITSDAECCPLTVISSGFEVLIL